MHVRTLLIEDNPADGTAIKRLLARSKVADFRLVTTSTLSSALDYLAQHDVDVVLCGLRLPGSHGLAAYRQIEQSGSGVPIVILSGVADEQHAIEALKLGAQDYLVKGQTDGNLLARSLLYAIERKRIQRELQRARDDLERRVQERTAELERTQEAVRKQREELAHAARLNQLGEMASGLAHELNQPLMAIIGFTSGCLQRLNSGEFNVGDLEPLLQETSAEAQRAGQIIKKLRRLVQKRESQRSMIHLNNVVRDTLTLIQHELDQRNIHVHLDLATSLPLSLADRIQIQQVIMNLIRNSIQAMISHPSLNGHQLRIKTRHNRLERRVEFRVSDSGPGMGAKEREQLFEPFYTTKPDGLGLGLPISRSIIEAHHGGLDIKPNDGRGLTVEFWLPLDRKCE